MKLRCLIGLVSLFLAAEGMLSGALSQPPAGGVMGKGVTETLDAILTAVENRYAGAGFTAVFDQESSLKAMDIKDTAKGKLFVKRPGKMRWEYESPERQIIITDGAVLWIYRPLDHQVMRGKAPSYFGAGKGAGFLSDIRLIREKFDVALEKSTDPAIHRLSLTPIEKTPELKAVDLIIDAKTFEVSRVVTLNAYGDETLITLGGYRFNQPLEDGLFALDIPAGADVVQLDE